MNQQTDIDFTEKQPTALMRLEKIVIELKKLNRPLWYQYALDKVLEAINEIKPSELADLKQSFCEGGIETESAETWAKKWGVSETK